MKVYKHADNLAWGTHAENFRDAVQNGHTRNRTGSKLTAEQREKVRLYAAVGAPLTPLAAEMGVSYAAMHSIAFGRKPVKPLKRFNNI